MKMIKLLVLSNGKMSKLPKSTAVGRVSVGSDIIGAVYSVSKSVYKKRNKQSIKILLINSINTCIYFSMPQQ